MVPSGRIAKEGQKSLAELDHYRYVVAPKLFAGDEADDKMDLEVIKILVEWKLRHGTFRPTLMSLVSSNDPKAASDTVSGAIEAYRRRDNASEALSTLTKLKGIGPATASLLLTVHDPSRAIFFSDEAFYWLCCGGKKAPVKYSAKEYLALFTEARELARRIDVSVTDIEKVAYVVMKTKRSETALANGPSSSKSASSHTAKKKDPAKRKAATTESTAEASCSLQEVPPRRSKRSKA
ncbi:hypothetical protein GMORB2_3997 [Geosmithia morbida]|uniref:Uncharacterized protein n=1 Tax=Geosmithia morbida TaxID=1094350 RepID=A0A9P4Z0R2_9HYPO|nr:uncharacterized protein GMORB2_3997 [Geosmithia morbida]KAF4125158.1 hypothetical protein GMORB2_3997 [Geosmithia morbida]